PQRSEWLETSVPGQHDDCLAEAIKSAGQRLLRIDPLDDLPASGFEYEDLSDLQCDKEPVVPGERRSRKAGSLQRQSPQQLELIGRIETTEMLPPGHDEQLVRN